MPQSAIVVGECVGESEGAAVGLVVGLGVGETEGVCVGAAVLQRPSAVTCSSSSPTPMSSDALVSHCSLTQSLSTLQ